MNLESSNYEKTETDRERGSEECMGKRAKLHHHCGLDDT